MEKKLYNSPLIEVAEISINGALMASPEPPVDNTIPLPPHPGNPAPMRRTEIF